MSLKIIEETGDNLYDLTVSSSATFQGDFLFENSGVSEVGQELVSDASGVATWAYNDGFVPDPEDWENSYSQDAVTRYVRKLSLPRKYQSAYTTKSLDASAVTAVSSAYDGAVYSPTENRVYFVPFQISDDADWHYVDCSDGSIVEYTHGFGTTLPIQAYKGAVYSPTQNRIYLVPYNISNSADWHYIDCSDGSVVAYTHGFGTSIVNDAYAGGVYSPIENRIYLVPFGISDVAEWHYIDCSDGSVVAYAHGYDTELVNTAYSGGVYSPTENRVYFSPWGISSESQWHYIDCSNNTGGNAAVVEYTNPGISSVAAFEGMVYSPTENRAYFVPYNLSDESEWYYIDCTDNTAGNAAVTAYTHGFGTSITNNAFFGGVFSPTQNRVYFVPFGISDETQWYYIDCTDNTAGNAAVTAYTHGAGTSIANNGFQKGIYSPTEDRVYFAPSLVASGATWYALGQKYITSGKTALSQLSAGAMFNYS